MGLLCIVLVFLLCMLSPVTYLATEPHRCSPGCLGRWQTFQHFWLVARKGPCWTLCCDQSEHFPQDRPLFLLHKHSEPWLGCSWNMKLFYVCVCVCVFYQQCAAEAIHQKWHQWTCEAGQRWGRLVTGESVHLCHLETNEPGCADSSRLGHSFPEERCNLVTQQNTN